MKYPVLLITIATMVLASTAWGQALAPASPFSLTQIPVAMLSTAGAATQANADDRWTFSLAIPLWLAGVDGDLTVRGQELSVDQGAGDAGLFESEINAAFALHVEAQKGRFGLLLDTMYLSESVKGTLDATEAEGTLSGFIGEFGAFYTLVPPAPEKRGWGMLRVDALGGLRISTLELGIDSSTFVGETDYTLYDPFVGARVEVGLTHWLSIKLRGDIGGFGISAWDTCDFSYNVDTALEFHLAESFDLGLGYRWLSYDFVGDSDSRFNATLSGPVLELKFNF